MDECYCGHRERDHTRDIFAECTVNGCDCACYTLDQTNADADAED